MYPVELLKNTDDIDLDWYKKMIENYIQGALEFLMLLYPTDRS